MRQYLSFLVIYLTYCISYTIQQSTNTCNISGVINCVDANIICPGNPDTINAAQNTTYVGCQNPLNLTASFLNI